MANSLKFGTSGLRGLASELVGEEARRYAAAFVRHVQSGGSAASLLVGRDLRASSPQIAQSVAEAASSFGLVVVDCGVLPTPALALEAQRLRCAAIMVTGSHIPGDRNGLKFYIGDEITKADEAGILAQLNGAPSSAGRMMTDPQVLARYRDRYLNLLPQGALGGLRIGVWKHSTVARELLVDVLGHYGAEIVPLGHSDAFEAVDTEAIGAETSERVAAWVRDEGLSALISSDGDADRPLIADETGAILRGDVIGLLTARFLGATTVVTPVTSNSAIEGTGYFQRVIRTKVGSPFVIDAMKSAEGLVVGFEANGGVLLGSAIASNGTVIEALPTRDAMLPILAVLGAARQAGLTVSALAATLPPRHARSDRLEHVAPERSAQLMDGLRADAGQFFRAQGQVASVSDVDGLRYSFSNGDIVHYRPSGNAPELRCYAEAATAARADELLAWGLAAANAVVR